MSEYKRKNKHQSHQIRRKIQCSVRKNKNMKWNNVRRNLIKPTHGAKASNFRHARKPVYNQNDFDRIQEVENGEYWDTWWGHHYTYSSHPDIGWWFDWNHNGNYALQLYKLNAESIGSYFIQFQTIKQDIYSNCKAFFEPQNKPTYQQYQSQIPRQMQFAHHISRFKPMLEEYLHYIYYTKCVDINTNSHTLFCHLKEEMFHFDQNRTFYDALYTMSIEDRTRCFHCDECREYRSKIDHFIWDFFCNDMEFVITEIQNQIQLKQQQDLHLINRFNEKYSKSNYNIFLQNVINTRGISGHICSVILDFVSHEYPIIYNARGVVGKESLFQNICKWNSLGWNQISIASHFEIIWIDDRQSPIGSDPGSIRTLHAMKHCRVFSESYCVDCDQIKLCVVGQVGHDMSDTLAYFCYTSHIQGMGTCHSIVFARRWLWLWQYIKNISIKINCYQFLFNKAESFVDQKKNPMLTRWGTLKFTHWNCYYDSLYYSDYS
eukprot:247151_1